MASVCCWCPTPGSTSRRRRWWSASAAWPTRRRARAWRTSWSTWCFLGTEKYPEVADFDRWLGRNGGFNNAYTADDRTHYMFEIRHDAFDGALDRFAQFLHHAALRAGVHRARGQRGALRTPEEPRERPLARTGAAQHRVPRRATRRGSSAPAAATPWGGTTREELLAFHRQHYGAEHMTLVLASPETRGAAGRDGAGGTFAAVPRRERAPLRYDPGFLPRKAALRVLRMEPVKEQRHLTMSFALPDLRPHLGARPGRADGPCAGPRGRGQRAGATQARRAWRMPCRPASRRPRPTTAASSCASGSPRAGLERHERVLAVVFAALAQVRREGLPPSPVRRAQAPGGTGRALPRPRRRRAAHRAAGQRHHGPWPGPRRARTLPVGPARRRRVAQGAGLAGARQPAGDAGRQGPAHRPHRALVRHALQLSREQRRGLCGAGRPAGRGRAWHCRGRTPFLPAHTALRAPGRGAADRRAGADPLSRPGPRVPAPAVDHHRALSCCRASAPRCATR
jgi:hypothetical protein